MGFLTCGIHQKGSSDVTVVDLHTLILSGTSGVFARHLPSMADDEGSWLLSAADLVRLCAPDTDANAIVFDMAQKPAERLMLYRLVQVSGRTASLITDALFHFKVLKPVSREGLDPSEPEVWIEGPDRYEQLRLDGGTQGGTWLWGESPTAVCATQL